MEHWKTRRLRTKKNRIIKKYDKLVDETIKRMSNNSMEELWSELDKLKQQMAVDFEKAGIVLES